MQIKIVILLLFVISNVFAIDDSRALRIKIEKMKTEQRVALVIGNDKYVKSLPQLKNPINDAKLMKKVLEERNFKVYFLENATRRQFYNALDKFTNDLRKGGKRGVGLFYFAGHGLQVDGLNYLVASDSDIEEKNDVKKGYALRLNYILDQMKNARDRLNIVILDACRNDPFDRGIGGGLAPVSNAQGMFIAYATAAGSVASDGKGKNGVFTKNLAKYIVEPLPMERVFKYTGEAVFHQTNGKQSPATYSQILGDFYFTLPKISKETKKQLPQIPQSTSSSRDIYDDADIAMWNSIKNSKSIEKFKYFLKSYPKSHFVAFAKLKLSDLQRKSNVKKIFVKEKKSVVNKPFIMVWNINSNPKKITIPINPNYKYNYRVSWGDGSVSKNVTASITHTYSRYGKYKVKISGQFPAIQLTKKFSSTESERRNAKKLLKIEQWGNIQWKSFKFAFSHARNLKITATDIPNLKNVKNMKEMFAYATSFNQPLNNWNVSHVENMRGMFYGAFSFNQPLNNWNVSHVKDMSYMFEYAHSFNQPLNNWDVSHVENMSYMFYDATSFNQSLNNWNVSHVKDMHWMFEEAKSFNQPLNNWNVSHVQNMSYMFYDAYSFNQPLNNWNVSHVKDMNSMFQYAKSFNQPLNNWNVSHVKDMHWMFVGAASFNQPLNNWNVSHVKDMSNMFGIAESFNQPLNNWNVSHVKDMSDMFEFAESFNQPLNNWNVSHVKDMSNMFHGAKSFNQPLNNWNVSHVTDYDSFADECPIDDTYKMPRFK